MKPIFTLSLFFLCFIQPSTAQEYHIAWGFGEFDRKLPNGMLIDSVDQDDCVLTYVNGDSLYLDRFIHGRDVAVDKWNNNIFVFDYVWGYYEMWPPYNAVNGNSGQDIAIRKSDEHGNEIWTKYLENPRNNNPWSVATDSEGNIIVCGFFSDSLDFDPGEGEYYLYATAGNDQNGFILKLDPEGELIFAKNLAGTEEGRCYDLAIDSHDNIYVVGKFGGTTDFDPGEGVILETTANSFGDLFALKLDREGHYLWHYTAVSTQASRAYDCVVDSAGALYLSGYLTGSIDFSNANSGHGLAQGDWDGFLVKIDSAGIYQWSRVYSTPDFHEIEAICFDGQDLIVTGSFKDSINVDPISPAHWLYGANGESAFFQKLDTAGRQIQAQTFVNGGIPISNIAVNSRRELFFSGSIRGQKIVDLPTGTDTINTLDTDVFCALVDAEGTLQWFKSWQSEESDLCFGTTVDHKDNVLLAGIYRHKMDLDLRDSMEYVLIGEGGGHEAYLFQLNQCDQYRRMSITACESYVSPSSKYTWSSSGTYVDTLPASTGCDSILTIDLTISPVVQTTVQHLACESMTSPSGNHTWDSSGLYFDTLSTIAGCDSILEVDLTITNIDPSVTAHGDTLRANHPTGSYRWLDCETDTAIPLATNATFIAPQSGHFAVEITDQTCVDTSACMAIIKTSTIVPFHLPEISVFPNPSTGQVSIQVPPGIGTYQLSLYNGVGQLMQRQRLLSDGLYSLALAPGVYWLEVVVADGHRQVERVVVR